MGGGGVDVCMLGKGSKTGHDGNQKWAFCLAWYHTWHICIALHESSLTDSKITLHLHPFLISAKRSPATLHLLPRHHGACMSMKYKLWFPLNKWLDMNIYITVSANSRDYPFPSHPIPSYIILYYIILYYIILYYTLHYTIKAITQMFGKMECTSGAKSDLLWNVSDP